MKAWTPKRREGKWRNFLTAEEADQAARLEAIIETARTTSAEAVAQLNPIRQRGAQRALHAERAGAK